MPPPALEKERIELELKEKYGGFDPIQVGAAFWEFGVIAWALGGDVKDKVVLDLGCGSTEPDGRRVYEPWLCRILYRLGAHPIGIDMRSLEGEEFEHYTGDMSDRTTFREIPSHSVDVASTFMVFDSPQWRENGARYGHLDAQLYRVVKPEGLFLCEE